MRTKSKSKRSRQPKQNRLGSVLLVVLVIVALLTLTAYTYTQTMLTEYEATMMYGSEIQAREAADSGVEYVAALLGNRTDQSYENKLHNPALFKWESQSSHHSTRTAKARFWSWHPSKTQRHTSLPFAMD